jgi:hypothetical protein
MMKNSIGETTVLHRTFGNIPYYKEVSNMLPSLRKFNQSEVAKERLKIINFFSAYGEKATREAFGADRKTVSRWRKQLSGSGGKLSSLVPKSTRPIKVRVSIINPKIIDFIKNFRKDHPGTGKEKLKLDVDEFCLENGLVTIATSTIGKIIKRNHFFFQKQGKSYHDPSSKWALKQVKKKKRLRIKHSPKPTDYGHILSDTVEKIIDGTRRYFISAIDAKLKFALTLEYSRLNSFNMTDFYHRFCQVYPLTIRIWQSDNGSENLKLFDEQLQKDNIPHLFIYPRCPKIDAFIERYNRTIQDECLDYHLDELLDIKEGNKLLLTWNLYYNTKRRHHSLNLLSPLNYLISKGQMSQMSVTST